VDHEAEISPRGRASVDDAKCKGQMEKGENCEAAGSCGEKREEQNQILTNVVRRVNEAEEGENFEQPRVRGSEERRG